jgi:WD40 repeat protein
MVRLWDLATNEIILRLPHANPVQTVSFNSDSSQLISSSGTTAVVWEVVEGVEIFEITGHNGAINHAVFSPDDNQIATAGADGVVNLWDVVSGKAIRTFSGHNGPILWVAFSEDGSLLATASVDKTARLWDVLTGQLIRTISGHTSAVTAVAFNPDGKALASASLDSTARITPLTTTEDLYLQAWNRLARPLTQTECAQYLHGQPCLTTSISGAPPEYAP